ncbi:MAG: glycosyltransferase [Planctomycetota bacterium]
MDTEKEKASKAEVITHQDTEISVIVPVVERSDNLEKLYLTYSEELSKITKNFEFIFVVDAHMKNAYNEIRQLSRKNPNINFVRFPKTFGESNALSVGFQKAKGRYIFTLSSYFQVEPDETRRLYDALKNNDCDIVTCRRSRESDALFNRIQTFLFHKVLKLLTGTQFGDISCGLRAMRPEIAEAFDVYGDLHRFIPILAEHQGFRVKELVVKQRKEDTRLRVYKIRTYLYRMIDLITLFFLLRFTYRPMRFFGLIGSILTLSGAGINAFLIYKRLFTQGFPLRDKPSLFLASLLMVIGIQIFVVGFIGEIIIYTHSRKAKHYNIKEIIE